VAAERGRRAHDDDRSYHAGNGAPS
jgi:hypothetical protein